MTFREFSQVGIEVQKGLSGGAPVGLLSQIKILAKGLYSSLEKPFLSVDQLLEKTKIDEEKLDPVTREVIEKTKSAPTLNNVQLFSEGPKAFHALSEAIRKAKKKIEINMFSWADDSTGMKIADDIESALKTNPQVNVTLRLDKFGQFFVGNKKQNWFKTIGNMGLSISEMGKLLDLGPRIMKDPNAAYGLSKEEKAFINNLFINKIREQMVIQENKAMLKLKDLQKKYPARFKMIMENNPVSDADHSKVIITDDTIFAGGMNVGDEYSGGYHPKRGFNGEIKKDYWKDYMMKFEPGPASTLYKNQFFHQTRTPQEDIKRMALEWAKSAKQNPKNFSAVTLLHNKGGELTDKEKAGEEKQITYTAFYLMQNAKSEILIEHAYIQDQRVVDIIKEAAARGVKVKIVRSKPESQELEKANEYYFRQLKGVGNVSIYLSNRVLHTKSLMIDGKYSIIGSCNLSTASLSYHEEQSLYVQGASPLNKQIKAGIEVAIKGSKKIQ